MTPPVSSRPLLRIALSAAALLLLLPLLSAAADPPASPSARDLADLSLEELMAIKVAEVKTASRFTQKVGDAPSSVTVITAEEIKLFGYRTLADVLESVRGLYVTNDRSYLYLGVRGFSRPSDFNSRVLVLVDGHRVNDNIFGTVILGRGFVLDADLIDRVEVVRGPASSLYGSSAFFGVVNVIMKRPSDLRTVEAAVEAGSRETYGGRATLAGTREDAPVEYVLSGSLFGTAGLDRLYYPEFDDPSTNDGVAEDLDRERSRNFYGSASLGGFTLSTAYGWREKHIPTASWGCVFNDPRYRTVDAHGYVDLLWERALREGSDLAARAYYDDCRYTADYTAGPYVSEEDQGLSRDDDAGRMIGAEAQWTRRWKAHTFAFGAEARRHLAIDQSYSYVAPRDVILDDHRTSYDLGCYAQGAFTIGPRLLLNAGLRYDYYESFRGTANPRLGLIYHPHESSILKLLYGTAYRAPNAFELYYEADGNLSNPDLGPETIRTYEAVLEQSLPANVRLSLSGFYDALDDLIAQIGDEEYQFHNVDEARSAGTEVELAWTRSRGGRVRVSYTFQRAEDEATGERLPNSPEHLARLNLSAPLAGDRLATGLAVRYTSSARTLPDRTVSEAGAFCLVDWTLFSARLVKGLELSAGAYNLFDARYAFPGGTGHVQDVIRQDGRSFLVRAAYRY